MNYTVPNCNECIHRRICNRKKVVKTIIEEVSTVVSLHESDSGINIDLGCEEFRTAVD